MLVIEGPSVGSVMAPHLAAEWEPRLTSYAYDPVLRPPAEKAGSLPGQGTRAPAVVGVSPARARTLPSCTAVTPHLSISSARAVEQETSVPAIEYFPAGYVNQAKDVQEHWKLQSDR